MSRQGRKHRKVRPAVDDEPLRLSRRAWCILVPATIALAIPGVVIYARDPAVGTYQLNGLLVMPLVLLVLYALHIWLPARVQWILALAFAPVGSVVYVLSPDAQWFNYGPLTVAPLAGLVARRLETGDGSQSFPAGMADGPWGPP